MKTRMRFTDNILAAIHKDKILGIRAGRGPHQVIGIWVVVVEGRVFVRSWSLKPRSWYRTFLEDPHGSIFVAGHEIPVRAIHTRSERLKDAVSQAYMEKYNTPGSIQYVRDLGRAKSRDTTTELIPELTKYSLEWPRAGGYLHHATRTGINPRAGVVQG